MSRQLPGVKFELIKLTPDRLRTIRPTKVLDIREGNAGGFHPDGLFSTDTFGAMGTVERDRRFSYIKTNTKVFHPKYYKELVRLKGLYKEILTGKSFAVFDESEKDFVLSDPIKGQTGYSFFVKNFPRLEFKRNASRQRNLRIDFLEKNKDSALYSDILVLPAGLRDIKTGDDGRDTEGEINEFYRRIIGASNSIASQSGADSPLLDTSRVSIQNAFNNVYDYLFSTLEGKSGFINGKWAKRGLTSGTRSVITGVSTGTSRLGNGEQFSYNQLAVGLFQAMKSYEPMVVHAVLGITSQLFSGNSATLIDKNTLKTTNAMLSSDDVDLWTTPTGISKIINNFGETSYRTKPITVGRDHYLLLVWTGKTPTGVNAFKLVRNIDEVPEWVDKKDVRPLTYIELFYISRLDEWGKDVYHASRYPITGDGSFYPAMCYLRTTVNRETRVQLDVGWEVTEKVANSYPVLENASYYDSISAHPARLSGLGADHDGDKMSSLSNMTKEAREEIYNYLNSPEAYIDGDGNIIASPYVDSVIRVLANITGF